MTATKTIKATIAAALVVALVLAGGGVNRPTVNNGRWETELAAAVA